MSAKLMGQVWELDLQHGEQLVMLALADHGEDDGSQIFPSVARLAWKTGYKERQVQNILRTLTDKGLIEPVANAQGGRGHATEYKMNIEKGAKKTPFIKGAKSERVQSATQKGAKSSIKGAIAIAPQPSYNHQETSYIAADAAPPQKPVSPSKKKATRERMSIQPEAVMVPPAPPVAPEQAAADLAAWDALEAAPPEARHGRAPSFQNDHWGWYEGLIYVTTGWTRREFEQKKSETVQKAYHAHAKKHHGLGRHVKTLLENFAPGGWRWQAHEYRTSKPNLGEIDQLWGDWEQTPVLNFPQPSAPRPAYVPPPIPEDVVKLPQERRRELRRLGLLQAGGLNGSHVSNEKHAG